MLVKLTDIFGLRNVPLLVQFVLDRSGEIYIIELSARTGGGCKNHLINAVTGVDITNLTIDSLVGVPTRVPSFRLSDRTWLMKYLYTRPGRISSLRASGNQPGLGIWFSRKEGHAIEGSSTATDRVGCFLISDENRASLARKLVAVQESLHVLDGKGRDILIRDELTDFF